MTNSGEQKDMTTYVIESLKEKAPEILDLVACSEVFDTSRGGAAKMCTEMDVPFLEKVSLDPQLCKATEEVRSCFVDQKCGVSAPALRKIIEKLPICGTDPMLVSELSMLVLESCPTQTIELFLSGNISADLEVVKESLEEYSIPILEGIMMKQKQCRERICRRQ